MKPDLPAVVCSSPHCWLYMPRKRRMPQQMPSRSQCPQAGRRHRARMVRRKAAETGSRQLMKVSALTAVALWRWKMKAMPKSAAVRSSAAWPIWKRGMVCGGGLGFTYTLSAQVYVNGFCRCATGLLPPPRPSPTGEGAVAFRLWLLH